MTRDNPYSRSAGVAERVVREHGITALKVDPIAIAEKLGIEVMAKPASSGGVSGMLIRVGNQFGIAYATHIDSTGFRRFSIAHELGHYFLPGHVDSVFADGNIHESHAGFNSTDRYEMEADHFAARLLMPNALFSEALRHAGDGLAAVERLSATCETSLTATAIRYAQCSHDPVAIIVSTSTRIDYCFMSKSLAEVKGLEWIRKGQPLPVGGPTHALNGQPDRVRRADRNVGTSDLQDWFGGPFSVEITEDVVGLGRYGKSLTVLHGIELPDEDEPDQDDDSLIESWTPRFRR
ncbi:MAG: ImmA/IrrE family metallo-endopeptidase [Gammaproteobacteria bacterium]